MSKDICFTVVIGHKESVFKKRLFGLAMKFWGWVQQIEQGTPLFLYNIDSKTLFGPFRTAGKGRLNIDPRAWENLRPLEFPAQVLVSWDKMHEIRMANKRFPFLKDGNLCKLSLEKTNMLISALRQAQDCSFDFGKSENL